MESRAAGLVNETQMEMLSPEDLPGRDIKLFSAEQELFGITPGACSQGTVRCSGKSTPQIGMKAHFAISCPAVSYFGTNRYILSPGTSNIMRPYLCEDEDLTIRPKWTLLGYFKEGDCDFFKNSTYDPKFCKISQTEPSFGDTILETRKPSLERTSIPSEITSEFSTLINSSNIHSAKSYTPSKISSSLPTRLSEIPQTSLPSKIPSKFKTSIKPTKIPSVKITLIKPTKIPSVKASDLSEFLSSSPSTSAYVKIPSEFPTLIKPKNMTSVKEYDLSESPSFPPFTRVSEKQTRKPSLAKTSVPSKIPSEFNTAVETTNIPSINSQNPTKVHSRLPSTRLSEIPTGKSSLEKMPVQSHLPSGFIPSVKSYNLSQVHSLPPSTIVSTTPITYLSSEQTAAPSKIPSEFTTLINHTNIPSMTNNLNSVPSSVPFQRLFSTQTISPSTEKVLVPSGNTAITGFPVPIDLTQSIIPSSSVKSKFSNMENESVLTLTFEGWLKQNGKAFCDINQLLWRCDDSNPQLN